MRSLYLRLSVTDHCNFRCAYCRPTAGDPSELRPGVLSLADQLALVEAIRTVAPLRKVRVTGGEPLVRAGVPDLVARLRAALPDAELCLTTNGSLLRRHARALRDAGLDRVNVSIDSVDAERFAALTGGARVAPVLDGVAAAREVGFDRIKLNSVLLRTFNGDGLVSLVRTAVALGCELRFIELMPLGTATRLPASEFLPADEALRTLTRTFPYVGRAPASDTAQRHVLRVAGRDVTVGFVSPVSAPFCGGCDRLRLDSRGRLFACLRRAVGLDLAGPLGEGRDDEVRRRIASVVAPKRPPESSWPERNMSTIGG